MDHKRPAGTATQSRVRPGELYRSLQLTVISDFVAKYQIESNRAAFLNNEAGFYLRYYGDLAGSRPCYERALAIREKALDLSNFVPQVKMARCLGCGLCVSSCPSGALSLVRKEEDERPSIPETAIMTHLQLGRARGKLKVRDLIMLAVRSKVDRLLA